MAEPRDMLRRFEDEFMNARCMMEGGMPWSSKLVYIFNLCLINYRSFKSFLNFIFNLIRFGSDSLMFPRRAMLPSMTNPLVNMFKDVDLFTMPGDSELIRCTQDKDKLEVRFRISELVTCLYGH